MVIDKSFLDRVRRLNGWELSLFLATLLQLLQLSYSFRKFNLQLKNNGKDIKCQHDRISLPTHHHPAPSLLSRVQPKDRHFSYKRDEKKHQSP